MIFSRLGIDTEEVLKASGTKWNFLPFRPGLVGGHCIGIDPYYLTHKAQELGYNPEIIQASRRLNDGMGEYVVAQALKLMLKKRIHISDAKVLILGLAFKENCPDLRNTRIVDIVEELQEFGANVDIYDPWVDKDEAMTEYDLELLDSPDDNTYDCILVAVAHDEFKEMGADKIHQLGNDNHVLYDIKYLLDSSKVDGRL